MTINKLGNDFSLKVGEASNLNPRVSNSQDELPETISRNCNATKKITSSDTQEALNEPRTSKAMLTLLKKSPVGLGNQQSKAEIENLGYCFDLTAMHIGAPVIYKSNDGGTITVYNGKGTKEMGEDQRKTVYEKDNYLQEMFYDENGILTRCEITIKDEVTGKVDPFGRMTMGYNEKGEQYFIR